MSTEDTHSQKVTPILGYMRSRNATHPKLPLQNVPSARELVQREFSGNSRVAKNEDVFDEIFRDMNDETFWQLIEFIEQAGYSILHSNVDISEAYERFQVSKSVPNRT